MSPRQRCHLTAHVTLPAEKSPRLGRQPDREVTAERLTRQRCHERDAPPREMLLLPLASIDRDVTREMLLLHPEMLLLPLALPRVWYRPLALYNPTVFCHLSLKPDLQSRGAPRRQWLLVPSVRRSFVLYCCQCWSPLVEYYSPGRLGLGWGVLCSQ